jgi:(E)-4-hydroxy-3-methylbut-2-enyl-diphosphate synthase
MADADYGYVGKTPGVISLYRGKEEVKRVPESEGVQALIDLIKADGRWVCIRGLIGPGGRGHHLTALA